MYEGFFDPRSTRIPLAHYIVADSLYLIIGLGLVQRSLPRLALAAEEYMAMPVSRTC